MNKIFIFILTLFLMGCQSTKYITIPLSNPPAFYYPNTNMLTQKDLIKEYQNSLKKISEWQEWYKINTSSNYFYKK